MSLSLSELPNEVLFKVIGLLSPLDLSQTRNVCKKLEIMCHNPLLWRSIVLEKDSQQAMSLWNLRELKEILDPHQDWIETIQIQGVRDNVMQYILSQCSALRELTVCGWLTLSEHAFVPPSSPQLSRLSLIGDNRLQTNFLSLDSVSLGQWVTHAPKLRELSVACQAHFQAEGLLDQLKNTSCSLQSLIISTKRTWCSEHITQLFEYCPQLTFLGLVPDGAHLGYDKNRAFKFSSETLLKAIATNQDRECNARLLLEKHSVQVEQEEIMLFDNIAIFKDL
ncbi:hypothetical protein BY458DRAFT_500511 [Sporodiniella umbellata]|nr:hypothetical protein BY458DRAFT_500511 [Sporodiniella umbellata]